MDGIRTEEAFEVLNVMTHRRGILYAAFTMMLAAVTLCAPGTAFAATAVYVADAEIDAGTLEDLSTADDDAGYLIALNETLGIILDPAIASDAKNNITIYTVAPSQGSAHATIRFGSYNNGDPIFVASRNVKAGSSVSVKNLLQNGCQLLGGCDYIEIITTRTNKGAGGVEVDYITVDGQVVEVASPTPEPKTWAMMIIAFILVAVRLKALRKRAFRPPSASASGSNTHPSPAT